MNTHEIASRIAALCRIPVPNCVRCFGDCQDQPCLCGEAKEAEARNAKLPELIAAELDKELKPLVENHEMQLAAISTASIQNTEQSAKDRIDYDNPYHTVAYGDVCRAIDREIELRAQLAEAQENHCHTREWYAWRFQRLQEFARAELPEDLKTRFFSIIANGVADVNEQPTFVQQFNILKHEIDQLKAQLSEAQKRIENEEKQCSQVIDERDRAEEWADKLADASGEVGEHTSHNNPWQNGLENIEGLRGEIDHLRAQLVEAQSVNKRVHDELLAEKEQVARMKSRHESNKAVVDGVWKQHEEQFAQLKSQLAEAQELLKAARAGQPLGPIIGAQTMLNQDNEIRQLKAQLASEQEKGRKAMQGLQKLTGYTFEIFHDGVGADLHDAGITTIEGAFMEGMQEATRELKDQAQASLRELEGEPTAPAPKT